MTKKRPDCKKLANKDERTTFHPKTQNTSRCSHLLEQHSRNWWFFNVVYSKRGLLRESQRFADFHMLGET